MVARAVKTTTMPNTPRQPIISVPQASGVVASRLPTRPIDSTIPAMVENRSGGNQREITTMLPISMTPNPAPISARPRQQDRPGRRQGEDQRARHRQHQHPADRAARAEAVEEKPQGICIAEKPKKKAPVSAPSASGPIFRSRIRSSPIVTLAALKK